MFHEGLKRLKLKYIACLASVLVAVAAAGAPRISLLTVGPGHETYQLEGHTALRVITDSGEDMVVNWGIFDFNSPNFAYRFVKGETDYSIGLSSMALFLAGYSREGRYVKEQPLDLTPAEAEEAMRLIEENLRPENRTYRYNYLYDNCATRPLAIIEKALAADGARLVTPTNSMATTIRGEMRRYHSEHPSYQLFIDFALGSEIDREATIRQRAFAPVYLHELAGSAGIAGADGSIRKLTQGSYTLLHDKGEAPKESGIPAWVFVALITLSAIAVTIRDLRKGSVSKWYDAALYALLGLAGCVLAFLVFISEHAATSPNINLMWADPICLIIPLIIWFKKCKCIVFYFQIINFALILIWLAGQPLFHQSTNLLFITLVCSDMLRCGSYIYLNRKCHDRPKA